jgi:signal transduction histidine kinase
LSQIEAIQRVSRALFSAVSLDDVLETALRTALEEVGAESGSILLADAATQTLAFRCSIGDHPVQRGTTLPWDRGIAGSVFQSGQAQLTRDVKGHPEHFEGVDQRIGHATRDMATIPLRQWRGDPIGVLNVLNKREGALDEDDLGLLTVISAFIALAIEQARLFEEAKLAEVARTLGNIGHDLKNLLTPLVSSTGLLSEELADVFARVDPIRFPRAGESRELCMQALGLIQRSGERMHRRVKEIADCVKGRSSSPIFARCEIARVAEDVMRTLQPYAAERGVILEASEVVSVPALHADEQRLYTALYNLVINAIAEVDPGGRVRIEGGHEIADEEIRLSVTDEGRGMPPEMRDAFTSGRVPTTKTGGTGLGIRIVRDVVEAHGGRLSVDSELGRGTSVTMRLPIGQVTKR